MEDNFKEIYKVRVSKEEFNLSEGVLRSCFNDGELLILLCRKEDDFLLTNERLKLRKQIPIELEKDGGIYEVVDYLDSTRFSAISIIKFTESSIERILNAYKYFYSFTIGKINIDVDKVFSSEIDFFKPDILCQEIVSTNIINYCIIKSLDGNEVFITLKGVEQDYLSLKKALNNFYRVELFKENKKKKWWKW